LPPRKTKSAGSALYTGVPNAKRISQATKQPRIARMTRISNTGMTLGTIHTLPLPYPR
jgi:hypothetical protein